MNRISKQVCARLALMVGTVALTGFPLNALGQGFTGAPDSVSFQGYLTTPGGDPVADGSYTVQFSLSGGGVDWSETQSVSTTGGYYNVMLGRQTTLSDVPFDTQLLLGVKVGADPQMSPKTPLSSAPYALSLRNLRVTPESATEGPNMIGGWSGNYVTGDALGNTISGGGNSVSGANRITDAYDATIGGGVDNGIGSNAHLGVISGGGDNGISGQGATISGGVGNRTNGDRAVVAGGNENRANDDYTTVSGGVKNYANAEGATIGGGGGNVPGTYWGNAISGDYGTIGGGSRNFVSGTFGTIAGGDTSTAGPYATVGGGYFNKASGQYAVVGGGSLNTATSDYATVAGGANNEAGYRAAVGGGSGNTASGGNSAIPGGTDNSAGGGNSFAAGNRAKANHSSAFVWGDGTAADFASTAANQFLIRASGGLGLGTNEPWTQLHIETANNSLPSAALLNDDLVVEANDAIIGLYSNTAGEFGSGLVLGEVSGAAIASKWGIVRTTGSSSKLYITYNDDNDYSGSAGLHFTVLSSGEVGIQRSSPLYPLHVGTGVTSGNGAHLTAGGEWTNGSSRTFKEGFEPIDTHDVLEKVAGLPVTRWRYKGDDKSEHIGPVAEDFYATFGLGDDERYIGTVDADGVSLAAIKALYELVQAQQERIEALESMIGDRSSADW